MPFCPKNFAAASGKAEARLANASLTPLPIALTSAADLLVKCAGYGGKRSDLTLCPPRRMALSLPQTPQPFENRALGC